MDAQQARRAGRNSRHAIGFALYGLLAVGMLVGAFAVAGGFEREYGSRAAPTTEPVLSVAPTTAPRPPAGPYKVTDGVNVRSGPGTSYSVVGTIELGKEVLVECTADGEQVTGPTGATTKWLRIVAPRGWVTQRYVETGRAIEDRNVIPWCPPG